MSEFGSKRRDRRSFLADTGRGIAGLGLTSLLADEVNAEEAHAGMQPSPNGEPHFRPCARNVIWLFLRGGLSHLESFDPKPELDRHAGKTIGESPYARVQDPERLKKVRVVVVNDANGQQRNELYGTRVGFKRYGESGIPVSDWFPHVGGVIDHVSVIRSMWTTDDNHGAQVQFHSGRHMLDPRVPTIGAWVSYGLGTFNDNLPRFVQMGPRFFDTRDGHYLGPSHDAVPLKVDPANPLAFARPELDLSREEQRIEFNLVDRLDRLAAERHPRDTALRARLESYQLAFRMQTAVPKVMQFEEETAETQSRYGLDDAATKPFGMQLLAARRLVERGVRFVQIMHGGGAAGEWDAHSKLVENHSRLSRQVDKPIAGLIADLARRGLLDETIVVLATEFGRTPGSQGGTGRDHHPYGFSILMAGGGLKGGFVHGATDELGFHAVEDPHYVTDVHATLHRQLGLDPRRLEVPGHKRLDVDYGHPIDDIIA